MRRLSRGRARRGPVLAVLCVLALAGCGSERAGDTDAKARPEGRRAADLAVASPAETEGPGFLAFMTLLTELEEPCLPDSPSAEPTDEEEPMPPGASLPELSLPDEAPPTAAPATRDGAPRETELGAAEECAADIHVRRITQALKGTSDPTPQQVAGVLHGLGYIDERIHGPQRAGKGVEFTLDLRVMGGQLCLSGNVTGTTTAVEPYGADVDVDCLDVRGRS